MLLVQAYVEVPAYIWQGVHVAPHPFWLRPASCSHLLDMLTRSWFHLFWCTKTKLTLPASYHVDNIFFSACFSTCETSWSMFLANNVTFILVLVILISYSYVLFTTVCMVHKSLWYKRWQTAMCISICSGGLIRSAVIPDFHNHNLG